MARKSTTKKSSSKITVNMEGVETRKKVAGGEYVAYPTEITKEEGADSGKAYLSWKFKIAEGDAEGAILYYNTSLQKQALWNLRGVLEAMGVDVPDDEMELDLEELASEDNKVGIVVERNTFEGKMRSEIVDFIPADDVDGSGNGDSDDKDEGGDDKPSDDEVDEMDEEELEKVIEKHGLAVDLDDHKKLKAKRDAVKEALEDAGESGEGDDKYDEDDVRKMDKDELKEIVKKHELEVTVGSNLKKARRQVVAALKENDLLEGEDD